MEFSIAQEVYVFLASVFAGLCICVVYDLLRVIRSYAKPSAAITDIEDIIFWGIAAVIMFFVVFTTNHGKVRWYEFFGVVLGSILYFFTLSRLFCFVIRKIIDVFSKIFLFFCKILLTPLLFTYNIVYKCILFIFVPVFKLITRWLKKFRAAIRAGTKRTKAALLKK